LWELTDYTVNTVGQKAIDVIWSYQNAARIDKPYIILDYTTDDVPDHEYYGLVDPPGYRSMSSWRKATVDMQFYCGPNSLSIASWLATMFASEIVVQKETELNVSIGSRLFLSRMPAMINTSQYEERAIYQFEFMYTEEVQEWVSWIATVEVTGEYSGGGAPDGTITCEETIVIVEITNWDQWTTGWDNGTTVWDCVE
jgi:hypothetical protein